jgi:dihydropteroate synthase
MVVGTSRKSFIKRVVGDDTRIGDGVVSGYCVGKGVDIIRCHDVRGIRGAVEVAERIYKYPLGESS